MSELLSLNSRFVTEAYKKEGLKSEVNSGFATVSQKNAVKGLKLLMNARLPDGKLVPKGSLVYIKEQTLYSPTGAASRLLKSTVVDGEFNIFEMNDVEFIYIVPETV